jgi:Tfp pilus assembly protein PilN
MTGLSVLAGAALVLLVWSVLEGYIDAQQGRNKLIADENRRLDAQIKAAQGHRLHRAGAEDLKDVVALQRSPLDRLGGRLWLGVEAAQPHL